MINVSTFSSSLQNKAIEIELEIINLDMELKRLDNQYSMLKDQIIILEASKHSKKIIEEGKEWDEKLKELNNERGRIDDEINSVLQKNKIFQKNHKILISRLDSLNNSRYFDNIYYALRALALGGLGALVSLLAKETIDGHERKINFFQRKNFWALLTTQTVLGGLIAIVAFALFYTKQLTIFTPNGIPQTGGEGVSQLFPTPEFWRVTMLCIIAGAFAEKFYAAAASRVNKYADEDAPKPIDETEIKKNDKKLPQETKKR